MFRFLFNKLARLIIVLLGAILIVFLLVHAIPGNPWSNYSSSPRMLLNLSMDKSVQETLNQRFGLNLPLWRQYTRYVIGDFEKDGRFVCGLICGNLGPSIQQRGRSVNDILFGQPEGKGPWDSRFGNSLRMVLLGALIAVGLGVPLGILSAVRPRSKASRAISVGLAVLISIPNFVLGLLTVIILASWLHITKVLPDWSQWSSWIVPACVLAVMPLASIARVTRASLINILNEDYVRTARAKGLTSARVMLVHILRNALAPILTFIGPALVEMFAGLLIIENLYAFPGFGREYWAAILNLDYPMIMGITILYALGITVTNMIIEVLARLLNPRITANQAAQAR